jgi:hypothetical protein
MFPGLGAFPGLEGLSGLSGLSGVPGCGCGIPAAALMKKNITTHIFIVLIATVGLSVAIAFLVHCQVGKNFALADVMVNDTLRRAGLCK